MVVYFEQWGDRLKGDPDATRLFYLIEKRA
ncbi:hypothetical protein EP10_002240 [Geobacillus icigianus]|uniref:Uncharacterized protein n=1 Tax=Geobacillus icigianus TaxID=1430331 RepID=A0ABU6BI44_9BACL|nr:hypothetical protein [Geobacillus icigianus]